MSVSGMVDIADAGEYINSLYNQFILVDAPDDDNRAHHLKTETVSKNIVATSSNGVFILYPNRRDNLIGFYYPQNSSGVITGAPTVITVAQDLGKKFDYGKKLAQLTTIQSSTLPAGSFQLSGNFNAVTYPGTLSEISSLAFDSILGITNEPLDKINQVLVGQGVGVIYIPEDLNGDYMRLGDSSPIGAPAPTGPLISPFISSVRNMNDPTVTTLAMSGSEAVAVNPAVFLTVANRTVNTDIVSGSQSRLTFDFTFPSQAIATPSIATVQLTIAYISPRGTTVKSIQGTPLVFTTAATTPVNYTTSISLDYDPDWRVPGFEPVTSVQVIVAIGHNVSGSAYTLNVENIQLTTTIFQGPNSGATCPTVVVAHDGLDIGTTLSIGGMANFALIPNPDLLANMPLRRTMTQSVDRDKVRFVMANRRRFMLQQVFKLRDLSRFVAGVGAAVGSDVDETAAVSFGFRDLMRWVGKAGKSVLKFVGKEGKKFGRQLLDEAENKVLKEVANAAGGKALTYGFSADCSSSGDEELEIPPTPKKRKTIAFSADSTIPPDYSLPEIERRCLMDQQECITIDLNNSPCVLFPVVLCKGNDIGDAVLYALVPGDLAVAHSKPTSSHTAGGKVRNYADSLDSGIPIKGTYTMLRVAEVSDLSVRLLVDKSPVVMGFSSQTALAVLESGLFTKGLFPYVVTGDLESRTHGRLRPTTYKMKAPAFIQLKKEAANLSGLELAANSYLADIQTTTVAQLLKLASSRDTFNCTRKYPVVTGTRFPVSIDDLSNHLYAYSMSSRDQFNRLLSILGKESSTKSTAAPSRKRKASRQPSSGEESSDSGDENDGDDGVVLNPSKEDRNKPLRDPRFEKAAEALAERNKKQIGKVRTSKRSRAEDEAGDADMETEPLQDPIVDALKAVSKLIKEAKFMGVSEEDSSQVTDFRRIAELIDSIHTPTILTAVGNLGVASQDTRTSNTSVALAINSAARQLVTVAATDVQLGTSGRPQATTEADLMRASRQFLLKKSQGAYPDWFTFDMYTENGNTGPTQSQMQSKSKKLKVDRDTKIRNIVYEHAPAHVKAAVKKAGVTKTIELYKAKCQDLGVSFLGEADLNSFIEARTGLPYKQSKAKSGRVERI